MTATNSQIQLSRAARLNAAGLVVAAAGIMIQYVSGEDFPTIPRGRSSCSRPPPWSPSGHGAGPRGGARGGGIVQIAGLAIALPAGVVAVKSFRSRAETRVASAAD
jgi:hypothetical protein